MALPLDPVAARTLKTMERKDPVTAERLKALIERVSGGIVRGSEPIAGENLRKHFGGLPHKLRDGKLRILYVPGQRVLAVGYRRDVYAVLPGPHSN